MRLQSFVVFFPSSIFLSHFRCFLFFFFFQELAVGHEGKPVEGVIIRLTRQTQKDENVLKRFALTNDSDSDGEDDVCFLLLLLFYCYEFLI